MTGDAAEHDGPRIPVAWLVGVFLLALGVRWAAVLQYEALHPLRDVPVIDERSYERWALEIAGGDWLGDEVYFQEPLYPYWLGSVYAAFGHDPPARDAARRIQAGLGALTAVLAAVAGALAFGRLAGLAAGVLLALYGPAVLMPNLLLKPNLFLPVLGCLTVALVWPGTERSQLARWSAFGLCAGLGALLRGNVVMLLPALVPWPFVARWWGRRGPPSRGLAEAACVAFGVALCLVPVAARNHQVGGVFALTTSGAGTNVYGGNNRDNPWGRATEFPFVRGIPEHEAGDWAREAERRTGRELSATEVSRFWLGEVARSVREDPVLHLRILWNKLRLTLGAYEVPDNHGYDWDARYVAMLRGLPGFGLTGALGLAGLFGTLLLAARRRGEPGAALALLVVLYLATIVLTVTSMRARLPLVVPLAPLAGAWVVGPLRPRLGVPRWIGCLAIGLAIANWPSLTALERAADQDKRDFNLAVAWARDAAHQDAALVLARELDAKHPGTSRLIVLVAELEAGAALEDVDAADPERRAHARATIEAALGRLRDVARHPDVHPRERFRAEAAGGVLQLRLGNGAAAESLLRNALAFDPGDPDLRLALANALALSGDQNRLAEARRLLRALVDEAESAPVREELQRLVDGLDT